MFPTNYAGVLLHFTCTSQSKANASLRQGRFVIHRNASVPSPFPRKLYSDVGKTIVLEPTSV